MISIHSVAIALVCGLFTIPRDLGAGPSGSTRGVRTRDHSARTPVRKQDPVPDEQEVRRRIDLRIQHFLKGGRPLGPGLVRECIVDTLEFGVPAYNSGDQEACARFYVKSAESLCAAFPKQEQTTSLGGRAIADLKASLARAAAHREADSKAWAIRYAFDKIMISWEAAVSQEKALLGLGNQNFGGARYAEAADAFHEAAELSADVLGQDLARADLAVRGAYLMNGHARLAEGRFRESAKAIMAGLVFVPEFPKSSFDLRSLFRADRYQDVIDRLKAAVEANPQDGDLTFLLGYVYHHTGKKDEARKEFDKVLKVTPGHAAAALYVGEGPEQKKAKDY